MRPPAFGEGDRSGPRHPPPDLRVVVLLADLEGYTYQEMADLLRLLDTVQARLHRARHRLAQALTASTDPWEREGRRHEVHPAGGRTPSLVRRRARAVQARRVQHHVAACPACQHRLQCLEALRAALLQARAPPTAPPARPRPAPGDISGRSSTGAAGGDRRGGRGGGRPPQCPRQPVLVASTAGGRRAP